MSLAIDPANASAILITVNIATIGPNPYRDMVMFPFQQDKIDSLVESIQQTGFWPSIIARPRDNMIDGQEVTQTELLALIESGHDFSDVEWEKSFAHHRQEACRTLGFETLPIIPQVLTDEKMLHMMALENKDGFGGNVNSQCETVRQVKKRLEESIQDYDSYDDYLSSAGDDPFFATSKSFKNAVTQGVGYRQVKRFLGETWSDMDVRAPFAVLKAVDKGYFLQEDVVNVPNLGLLNELSSIVNVLYEGYTPKEKDAEPVSAPDWPEYYKWQMTTDIIERISADRPGGSINTTVSDMTNARQALQKNEVSPASYLKSKKGKTPFNVLKAVAEEFLLLEGDDVSLDKNVEIINGLVDVDGLGNWEGFAEVKEKLIEKAEKAASGDADVDGEDGLEADANEDVGGVPDTNVIDGAFPDSPTEGADVPVGQLMQNIAGDSEVMSSRLETLLARVEECPDDEIFSMAVSNLLDRVARVVFATSGKEALVEAFNTITKE